MLPRTRKFIAECLGIGSNGWCLVLPLVLLTLAVAVRLDSWFLLPGWCRLCLLVAWVSLLVVWSTRWLSGEWLVRPSWRLLTSSLLLAGASLLTTPDLGGHFQRFLLPFYTPPGFYNYQIIVSSGDTVVARGGSVTLAGYVRADRHPERLPKAAWLRFDTAEGRDDKPILMERVGQGAFSFTISDLTEDLHYAIEAGDKRSKWHRVRVVDPVKLAAGTSLTFEPPAYVSQTGQADSEPVKAGFGDRQGIQHGQLNLQLQLNRPAVDAYLIWRTANGISPGPVYLPIRLNADRTAGEAQLTVEASGQLKLILVAEGNYLTEQRASILALPDLPPQFMRVEGLTRTRLKLRPDRPWTLSAEVKDDVAVAEVCLELRHTNGQVERLPLQAIGTGTPEARGTLRVADEQLARLASDSCEARLVAQDNRKLPERRIEAWQSAYPNDGWCRIEWDNRAPPCSEQEILDHSDFLAKGLTPLVDELAELVKLSRSVSRDAAAMGQLDLDQRVRFGALRERMSEAAIRAEQLGGQLTLHPDFLLVAASVKQIGQRTLNQAEAELREGLASPGVSRRQTAFTEVQTLLQYAHGQAAAILSRNGLATDARLAQLQLQQLIEEWESASTEVNPSKLLQFQLRLEQETHFRLNLDAANLAELKRLIKTVQTIAADFDELGSATLAGIREHRDRQLNQLAKDQADLNERLRQFQADTASALRLNNSSPLSLKPAEEAMALLTIGRPADAAAEQEKLALELDRLGNGWQLIVDQRADAKEAVRQLAAWQTDLGRRLADRPPRDDMLRKTYADEQQAIARSLERVALPPVPELHEQQRSLITRLVQSSETLQPSESSESAKLLLRLTDRTPSKAERLRASSQQAEAIMRKQAELARRITTDASHAELHKRQLALSEQLGELDWPGLDHRLVAVQQAMGEAAELFEANRPGDIGPSLRRVKIALDRLTQSANGETPLDDRVASIAARQSELVGRGRQLAEQFQRPAWVELRNAQSELANEIDSLRVTEYPLRWVLVRQSVAATQRAAQANQPEEYAALAEQTARELRRTAVRLEGSRADWQRLADCLQLVRGSDPKATPVANWQLVAEELPNIRTGNATAERQQLEQTIADLSGSPLAERESYQTRLVAQLEALTDRLATDDQRTLPRPRPEPDGFGDPFLATPAVGPATANEIRLARELAESQRQLRDRSSLAASELLRGRRPKPADPLDRLAVEQAGLAAELSALPAAQSHAQRAARLLQFGQPAAATTSGTLAGQSLRDTHDKLSDNRLENTKSGPELPLPQTVRQWAVRQAQLVRDAEATIDDTDAIISRQYHEAKGLANGFQQLGQRFEPFPVTVLPSILNRLNRHRQRANESMGEFAEALSDGQTSRLAEHRRSANAALVELIEGLKELAPNDRDEATPPEVEALVALRRACRLAKQPTAAAEHDETLLSLRAAYDALEPVASGVP